MSQPLLQLRGLNCGYHAHKVVQDLDLHLNAGDIGCLLGPSGCGKTTTLKMINRIVKPSSGKVFINGDDTTGMDTQDLRRNIGYVIQQIGLFPNMTIEENIAVVPKLLGWDKARYKERARELMHMIALEPDAFLKRYPSELSGGQQQRIGVARALAADPPVMLMDEPFGAVDPLTRDALQVELARVHRQTGKTIVFVTHDMDEALTLADRLVVMHEGQIMQQGHPLSVLRDPANDFVASLLGGEDRGLKEAALLPVSERMMPLGTGGVARERIDQGASLREALSVMTTPSFWA